MYDHLMSMIKNNFNNEWDVYMSFKIHEESEYNLDLDLLAI